MRKALRWFVMALVVTLLAGCGSCGKKTDEEILREKIDVTSVHLYVATKIAITKSDASPEAAEARRQLVAILEVLDKAQKQLAHQGAAPAGSAAPAVAPAQAGGGEPRAELDAAALVKLVKALWSLRAQGKSIVQSGREDDLPPFLPVLMGERMPPELGSIYDVNTEHALVLTALFTLKFHPKTPVPIPDEILLHEAWMTRTAEVKLEGLTGVFAAIKAVVYGNNELCDLALTEANVAASVGAESGKMSRSFQKLSGGKSSVDEREGKVLGAAARALAHGSTARCYLARDEREKGMKELQRFVEAAHEMGVTPGETAMVRAYIAYENKDIPATKKALEEARDLPTTDAETRAQLIQLLGSLDDEGAVGRFFTKPLLTVLTVKIVLTGLERSGIFDEIVNSEVGRTLHDYVYSASRMLSSVRDAIPSFGDTRAVGSSMIERLGR
jgi:hypothetical protein